MMQAKGCMLCRKRAQVQLHVLIPLLCYLLILVRIMLMLTSLLTISLGSNHLVHQTPDVWLLPNVVGKNTF